MIATNHALSGSLIGALLPLPIAVPVAFASHFVLDAMPHYGIVHRQRNNSATYKLIVFSDTFIALSIAASAALLHKWRMEAFGWWAYSPDAFWVIYYFTHHRNLNLKPRSRFMRFHMRIQRYERPWGIAVDLMAAAAMFPFFVHELIK
jgi:hypothetical protein